MLVLPVVEVLPEGDVAELPVVDEILVVEIDPGQGPGLGLGRCPG